MAQLTHEDYYTLEEFVKAAVERVESGKDSSTEAIATIMHSLNAWDKGNETEFGPKMRIDLKRWSQDA